jgi:single-strand DNA-binding protein
MGINTATLSGRLGGDPDIKYLESGKVIASFNLAVDGYSKGEKKTLWFRCKAWDKVAELIGEHCKTGNQVTVSGPLDIEVYETDTGKKSVTVLVVRDIQLPPKGE